MTVLECGTAERTHAGERASGDRGVVLPFDGGALVAVIDGLGHGRDACLAAEEAVRVLEEDPRAPVEELVRRCHDRLRKTRGAVITLASVDAEHDTLRWLGVGNVEALLVHADPSAPAEAIAARGGTVGFQLPRLDPKTLAIRPGDTLVLATDGVKLGFRSAVASLRSPQQIADDILAGFGKGTDDACVVVARYVGSSRGTSIAIDDEPDIAHARNRTRDVAQGLGFARQQSDEVALAVSELARNIIDHARRGTIVVGNTVHEDGRSGIIVIAHDRGPGIRDVARALEDGYSTSKGLGLGLPAARRLVDELVVDSSPGVGTSVTLKKWRR